MRFFLQFVLIGLLYLLIVLKYEARAEIASQDEAGKRRISILLDSCWRQRNTDPESSKTLGLKAIELARSINDRQALMKAYSFTGVAYRNIGYFDEAIHYYSLGFDIAQELNDIEQMCYGYINLGNLHFYLESPEKALAYLNKVRPLLRKIDNKNIEGYLYLNLGRAKLQSGDYDSALYYIGNSLVIRKKQKDNNAQAACLKYLGDAYLKKKDFNKAFLNYEKAQEVYDLSLDKHLLGNLKVNLARAYMESNHLGRAQQNADRALSLAIELHSLSIIEGAYLVLSEIAYRKRRFEASAQLLQKAMVYQDSINSQELQDQLERFSFSMEKLQFKYDKEILRLKNRQRQIIYLLVFVFLLAIIAVIIRVNYLMKKKNTSLSRQNREINSLSKLKKDLISMIAHDLKNPLHSIIGMTQKKLQEHHVQYIRQSGKGMLNLITNMLEVNRMEEEEINLRKSSVALHQRVQQSLRQLGFQISQKGHTVHNQLPPDLFVEGDVQYLDRVLSNLLSNAIKFIPNAGEISISALVEEREVEIRITDNGHGISEQFQGKVFDKFWSWTYQGQRSSSGLGLTFCKMAIEAHGGTIGVRSVTGKSTTFWFTLKLLKPTAIFGNDAPQDRNPYFPQIASEEYHLMLHYMKQLINCKIYEISKINAFLKTLSEKTNSVFLENWIRHVERAYQNGDENLFRRLTSPEAYKKVVIEEMGIVDAG